MHGQAIPRKLVQLEDKIWAGGSEDQGAVTADLSEQLGSKQLTATGRLLGGINGCRAYQFTRRSPHKLRHVLRGVQNFGKRITILTDSMTVAVLLDKGQIEASSCRFSLSLDI